MPLIVLLLALGAAPAGFAKPPEEQKWFEVRTANFQVRSALSEKRSVELAKYMEAFHAAAALVTTAKQIDTPVPTYIYAFKRPGDLVRFGFSREVAGAFSPRMRNNFILLRNTRGMDETSTILHEYVHYMLRNTGGFRYPKWYDEGLSEYLSAAELDDEYFSFGKVADQRVGSLAYSRWIPADELLAKGDEYYEWRKEKRAMYYAQSWLLVHYLVNRPDRNGLEIAQYLEHYETGRDHLAAFESAYGMTPKELDKALKKYRRGGEFRYGRIPLSSLLPEFAPQVRQLSVTEIALGLGQLALSLREYELAENWYTQALADETTRPWAEAGLGDLKKFAGEYDAAEPHFFKAVELAPEDPYVQLDLAEYWHSRARDTKPMEARREMIKKARSAYARAWQLDDSIPETYLMLGDTFVMLGDNYPRALELIEEAEYLLPSHLGIRALLAETYYAVNRHEDAAEKARSVLAWSHNDSGNAERARYILQRVMLPAE